MNKTTPIGFDGIFKQLFSWNKNLRSQRIKISDECAYDQNFERERFKWHLFKAPVLEHSDWYFNGQKTGNAKIRTWGSRVSGAIATSAQCCQSQEVVCDTWDWQSYPFYYLFHQIVDQRFEHAHPNQKLWVQILPSTGLTFPLNLSAAHPFNKYFRRRATLQFLHNYQLGCTAMGELVLMNKNWRKNFIHRLVKSFERTKIKCVAIK